MGMLGGVPGVFLAGIANLPKRPGAGFEVIPNLTKCRVPVLKFYRVYPSVRSGYSVRY